MCDPIDGSPPGSPISGILQARTLEWVAISFSNAWKWKMKVKLLSRVWLFKAPWTAAYQAPPSTGFSRQEYWSGVPLPSPIILWDLTKNDITDICCFIPPLYLEIIMKRNWIKIMSRRRNQERRSFWFLSLYSHSSVEMTYSYRPSRLFELLLYFTLF